MSLLNSALVSTAGLSIQYGPNRDEYMRSETTAKLYWIFFKTVKHFQLMLSMNWAGKKTVDLLQTESIHT